MSKRGKGVALVTGASSGIGEATADRLARAGYTVFGTSRRPASTGRLFEMLTLDVTRDESVDAVVQDVLRQAGRIDLLVNNAGFGVAPAAAEESSIEQAQAIFDTNFMGIVRMTRAVVLRNDPLSGGNDVRSAFIERYGHDGALNRPEHSLVGDSLSASSRS